MSIRLDDSVISRRASVRKVRAEGRLLGYGQRKNTRTSIYLHFFLPLFTIPVGVCVLSHNICMYITYKQQICIYQRFVFNIVLLIEDTMQKVWRLPGATPTTEISEDERERTLWENWKMSGDGRSLGC